MAEVSSLLYFGIDADGITGLSAVSEGDTIFSSVLPENIRETYTVVYDNSSTWEAGGSPSAEGFQRWDDTYEEVRDTSSDLRQASSTLYDSSGRWQGTYENFNDTSANLITASGRVDDLIVFSGSVETSTADIAASTVDISGYISSRETTWESGGSPSAEGFERWDDTYEEVRDTSSDLRQASSTVNDGSGRWEGTYENFNDTSADLITASGRVDDLIVFSGSVETSTANLSSTLDTSVGNLRSSIAANTGLIAINTSQLTVSGPYWNKTYEEVRDTSADLRSASSTLNDSSGNWQNTYDEVRDTSADLRDVSSLVNDNSGAWAVTSGIASGFGFIPDGPTKTLSSVEISGFGAGDVSGVTVFDGAIPVYSSALGRFNYLPDLAKPGGGYGARWDPTVGAGGTIEISQDGTFVFTSPDGQSSVMIDTSGNYLSGTATFDMSGIRRLVAATVDSNTLSAVNLTVEDTLTLEEDVLAITPRGYRATSKDRFAVNGSSIGSGADNLYVTNGAGPFIYYETSTNGSVRTGSNELGLGATPGYTVSSTPDSYLSGTIPAFYDNSAYFRTVVSSTGVYEIQAMLNVSSTSEIDVTYQLKIDNVADMTLVDTLVGITSPHYMLSKLQKVKFLNAGQEIRITLIGSAAHLLGAGSNLLIRRIA